MHICIYVHIELDLNSNYEVSMHKKPWNCKICYYADSADPLEICYDQ